MEPSQAAILPSEASNSKKCLKDIHHSLEIAATRGDMLAVKQLLDHDGVSPDSKNTWGWTPFSLAVRYGHKEVVELLLNDSGVDVNTLSKRGQTPLSFAARFGHGVIVGLLLNIARIGPDIDDDFNRTALSWAAGSGHVQVVRLLLEDRRVNPNSKDQHNRSPLWWAMKRPHEAVIKLLLDITEVDAEMIDEHSGRTLLSHVAQSGNEVLVRLLLGSERVDPHLKDMYGLTPLMWAMDSGHETVVEILPESGRMSIPVYTNLRLEIVSQCIAHWIKSCDIQHHRCCQAKPIQNRLPHQIPDWVIDTSGSCLVAGSSVNRYIALSYVWNHTNNDKASTQANRLMLTRSNLVNFQKPGFLDEDVTKSLPVVVSDTITLVQKLGERYLWVDCFCIIQDDQTTRDQVDHM
jgi:ankyrin repeat protein